MLCKRSMSRLFMLLVVLSDRFAMSAPAAKTKCIFYAKEMTRFRDNGNFSEAISSADILIQWGCWSVWELYMARAQLRVLDTKDSKKRYCDAADDFRKAKTGYGKEWKESYQKELESAEKECVAYNDSVAKAGADARRRRRNLLLEIFIPTSVALLTVSLGVGLGLTQPWRSSASAERNLYLRVEF